MFWASKTSPRTHVQLQSGSRPTSEKVLYTIPNSRSFPVSSPPIWISTPVEQTKSRIKSSPCNPRFVMPTPEIQQTQPSRPARPARNLDAELFHPLMVAWWPCAHRDMSLKTSTLITLYIYISPRPFSPPPPPHHTPVQHRSTLHDRFASLLRVPSREPITLSHEPCLNSCHWSSPAPMSPPLAPISSHAYLGPAWQTYPN